MGAVSDKVETSTVYASSGPRIGLRFFGGWTFSEEDARAPDLADRGYAGGVPMGSNLSAASSEAPTFLLLGSKDPYSGNLDRIQIIKGWLNADGTTAEQIYNVALSDGRQVDSDGNAPPVGSTVDLATAGYTNDIGDALMSTVWTDPDFNPNQRAFYYARVLEIPTPRHSLMDAIALQQPHPEGYAPTIQERAISSPIWYMPPE